VAALGCAPDYQAPPPRFHGAGATSPHRGGTLRFSIVDDVRGLDPAFAFDEFSLTAEHLLYDTLVDFAPALAADPLAVVPDLAETWSVSSDGLVYTFTIRAGATFSDGEPVLAEDFQYSFSRLLSTDVASPGAQFYSGISSTRAVDDRHFEIRLSAPDVSFLQRLAMVFVTPQKRTYVAGLGGRIGDRPLGTGPFVLEEWKPGERMVFARNARYWNHDLPYLDRIVLELLVPPDVAALKFMAGELETVDRLRPDDYLRLARTAAWAPYIDHQPSMQVSGEGMNVTRKPFDDRRVRLAMNYAIDKRSAIVLSNGRAVPAHGILPPPMPGYDESLNDYPYDPALARQLLTQAGYRDGFDVTYTTYLDPLVQTIAQSIQADLAQVGVRVHLSYVTSPAFYTAVGRGELDFFPAGWTMDFPDPSDFLDTMFHSRSITPENSNNYGRYSNPALDTLLDRARIEPNARRRLALYREAERLIHDDAPWIFHYHLVAVEARQPYVMGYRPHPVWLRDYRRAWLDEPRRPW
jgi:ABC-type transport system substrate-binding protein